MRLINAVTAFAVLQNIAGSYLLMQDNVKLTRIIDNRNRYLLAVYLFNAAYLLVTLVGSLYLYSQMGAPDAYPVFVINIFKVLAVVAFGAAAIVTSHAWVYQQRSPPARR